MTMLRECQNTNCSRPIVYLSDDTELKLDNLLALVETNGFFLDL